MKYASTSQHEDMYWLIRIDEPVVGSDSDYGIVERSVSESSFEFSSCRRELDMYQLVLPQ